MKKIFLVVFILFFSFNSVFADSKSYITKNLIFTKNSLEEYKNGKKYIKAIDYYVKNKASTKKLEEIQDKTSSFLKKNDLNNKRLLLIVKYVKYRVDLELLKISSEKVNNYVNDVKSNGLTFEDRKISNRKYNFKNFGAYLSFPADWRSENKDSGLTFYNSNNGISSNFYHEFYDSKIKNFDDFLDSSPYSEIKTTFRENGYSIKNFSQNEEKIDSKTFTKIEFDAVDKNGTQTIYSYYYDYKNGYYQVGFVVSDGKNYDKTIKSILASFEVYKDLKVSKDEKKITYKKYKTDDFSFYYPTNWKDYSYYGVDNVFGKFANSGESITLITEDYSDLGYSFSEYYNKVVKNIDGKNLEKDSFKVNGLKVKETIYERDDLLVVQYSFHKSGIAYNLTFGKDLKDKNKYKDIFDYVLNSFEFE